LHVDKIQILTTCRACSGRASLLSLEAYDPREGIHIRQTPCAACDGTGRELRWIDLRELIDLLRAVAAEAVECPIR
jgi:hypothetical protein